MIIYLSYVSSLRCDTTLHRLQKGLSRNLRLFAIASIKLPKQGNVLHRHLYFKRSRP
jgi:predicted transglutaminase-like protease